MKKTEAKRRLLAEKIADHLLAFGLRRAGLRALAAAAGTSDRMLLHYFADKRDLLTASLLIVTERLVALLENARSNRMPMERLLPHLAGMVKDPLIRPYTRLWLELVALAAGGDESCQGIAQRISDIFCAWIASALEVEREEERMPMASFVFATVEGFVLLDAMDCGSQITSALEAIRAHMGERWSEERPPLPGDAL